jgi:hypothetical protein
VVALQFQKFTFADSGSLDPNRVRQRRALCEVNAALAGSWNCMRTAAFITARSTTATQARMKLRIDVSRFSDRALCQLGIDHRVAGDPPSNRQPFVSPNGEARRAD